MTAVTLTELPGSKDMVVRVPLYRERARRARQLARLSGRTPDWAEALAVEALAHYSLRGPALAAAWRSVVDAVACRDATPRGDGVDCQAREDAICVLLRGSAESRAAARADGWGAR